MLARFSRGEDAQKAALEFRPDIQGLRAVAVLSVVFFHLKVFPFSSGYLGVDMFFVISGYLITRNILTDMESRHFSFASFYARRIRRIFPAMLVTIAATLVMGALWLPPSLFVNLAKSGFASLVFFSNGYFWLGSQEYFSPDASMIPLLHLWSLSVEEQFYIFWPLIILAISTIRLSWFVLCIAAIGAASFAAAFFIGKFDGSAIFYLMPFRIYQFSLGAFVLGVERWIDADAAIRRMAQVLGLAFCAVGIFALTSHLRIQAVAPSLGTALVIYGGAKRTSMPVLINAVGAYVGRISYSLYLVHWPVAVFASYVFGQEAGHLFGLIIQVIVMLILAALSYRFVERPFLSPHNCGHKTISVGPLISSSVALGVISIAVIAGNGWNWRLNAMQQRINTLEAFGVAPCAREETSCVFGAAGGPISALLIGDSYAQHYVAGIDRIARGLGVRAEEKIQQGCLVLSGLMKLGYPDDRCRTGRDRVLAAVKQSTAPVIISQAWLGYQNGSIGDDKGRAIDVRLETKRLDVLRQGIERTIKEIARPNRRILIIGAEVRAACDLTASRLGAGPLPHERNPPCRLRSREEVHRATVGVNNMLTAVQAKYPGIVSLVFPMDYMCDAVCPVAHDGISFYEDAGHLTVAGSLRFGEHANTDISNFLVDGSHFAARGHPADAPGRSH